MKINSKHRFLLWTVGFLGPVFSHLTLRFIPKEHSIIRSGLVPYLPDYDSSVIELDSFNGEPPRDQSDRNRNYHHALLVALAHQHTWENTLYALLSALESPLASDINSMMDQFEQCAIKVMKETNMETAPDMLKSIIPVLNNTGSILPYVAAFFPSDTFTRPHNIGYYIRRIIGKNQMSNHWPMHRENLRSALGLIDMVPPSCFPTMPSHFVHRARNKPENIAYTPNLQYLIGDRQLSIRPGRYLSREFPFMDNEQIKDAVASFTADIAMQRLFFAESSDDAEEIYQDGPSSCMDGSHTFETVCHPSRVYFSPDTTVVALRRQNGSRGYSARAVVNKNDKVFGRVYGDEGVLSRLLKDLGYRYNERALNGCRLAAIDNGDYCSGSYVFPYIDGFCYAFGIVEDSDGEWFIPSNDSMEDMQTIDADATQGYAHFDQGRYCEWCEERRDIEFTTIHTGTDVCQSCIDNYFVEAHNLHGWTSWVEINNEDLVKSECQDQFFVNYEAAINNGFLYCEYNDDYMRADDLLEDISGEYIPNDEAFPVLNDSGDVTFMLTSDIINEDMIIGPVDGGKLAVCDMDFIEEAEFTDRPEPLLHFCADLLFNGEDVKCIKTDSAHYFNVSEDIYRTQPLAITPLDTYFSSFLSNSLMGADILDSCNCPALEITQSLHKYIVYSYLKACKENRTEPCKPENLPYTCDSVITSIHAIEFYLTLDKFKRLQSLIDEAMEDNAEPIEPTAEEVVA